MAQDFWDNLTVGLYSDASAAIAISQRTGLGKLRHIQTQYLWLQERVAHEDLDLKKVVGTANPADMLTKAVDNATLTTHLTYSGLRVSGGARGCSTRCWVSASRVSPGRGGVRPRPGGGFFHGGTQLAPGPGGKLS